MYAFVTGPLLWLSFGIFIIGVIARIVMYIKGLDWKLDRVTYTVNVAYGIKGALRSIFVWLIPFGTRSWRVKPGFTVLFFVFHFGQSSQTIICISGLIVIFMQQTTQKIIVFDNVINN